MRTIEVKFYDMCNEIDELREEVEYWKQKYRNELDERVIENNERFKETQIGVANALMFALSVKDNPDGSLSINKADRKMLANRYSQSK